MLSKDQIRFGFPYEVQIQKETIKNIEYIRRPFTIDRVIVFFCVLGLIFLLFLQLPNLLTNFLKFIATLLFVSFLICGEYALLNLHLVQIQYSTAEGIEKVAYFSIGWGRNSQLFKKILQWKSTPAIDN